MCSFLVFVKLTIHQNSSLLNNIRYQIHDPSNKGFVKNIISKIEKSLLCMICSFMLRLHIYKFQLSSFKIEEVMRVFLS